MNKFIALHCINGCVLYVNTAHLVEFFQYDGRATTVITTVDHDSVKESPDEILKIIRGEWWRG